MNRKQRRAQAGTSNSIRTADDIPLAEPDRTTPKKKTKTLFEIAAEKQAELLPQAGNLGGLRADGSNLINVKVGSDGKVVREDTNEPFDVENLAREESDALPPLVDTSMLAVSLAVIHFTLETLTMHQYAQELHFAPIIKRTILVSLPTFFLLVHLAHGHIFAVPFLSSKVKYILLQLIFVAIANAAGCYLIQVTNDKGYYAVMKKAPNIGTIWVWSIIELGLLGALAGVIGPALYAWRNGYGIF